MTTGSCSGGGETNLTMQIKGRNGFANANEGLMKVSDRSNDQGWWDGWIHNDFNDAAKSDALAFADAALIAEQL